MYFYGIRFLNIFFSILVQSYKSRFFFYRKKFTIAYIAICFDLFIKVSFISIISI